jgi:tetratricopeptide (TPR) repeat protein
MPLARICGLVGLVAAALTLVGCRSAGAGATGKTAPSGFRLAGLEEDFAPLAVSRRTEAHARYALGYLHLLHDELDDALAQFAHAARLDPGNEGLVLEVTERLIKARKTELAYEILTEAVKQPGASAILFARLALVCQWLGKTNSAIDAAKIAIARNPKLWLGYQCLAQAYFQNKQRDEALKVLEQASQQEDVDAGFLLDLVELYRTIGGPATDPKVKAQATRVLERVDTSQLTNPLWLQRVAELWDALGQPDRATAAYNRLLEQYPNLIEVRRWLAERYLRSADLTNAAVQLQLLIRDNPTDPRPYFFLGAVALEQRKYKEAIDHFNKAILLNPDYEPAYYDLAVAQLSAREPKAALATLEQARAKFERSFQSEYYAGLAYHQLKDYTNALQRLLAAETIASSTATNRLNHIFYFQLGAAYERTQQYDQAERILRKVLAMKPDFSEALNYLGYMWAERGTNLAEARLLIEQAVSLEPTNAAYLDSMAWVLFKQGQVHEALDWMLKAIQHSDEPDATLYDHLGDIYAALNQLEKARQAWQKALDIEPNDTIRKKLADTPTASGKSPP